MTLVLALTLAHASDAGVASQGFHSRPLVGRPLLELRGGLDSIGRGRVPQICGEVHVLPFLALDACGTGATWFHQQAADEMSHYRVEGTVPLLSDGRGEVLLQPGLGFAEVQAGNDAPGFRFETDAAPAANEAAGPEASLSVKGRLWLHEKVYGIAEANAGLAHIPAAPAVMGRGAPNVPSATLTLGLGF